MKMKKMTPNFEVRDIRNTVTFYESVLGFSLVMAVPEAQDGIHTELKDGATYVYALIKQGESELMFQRSDSFRNDVPLVSHPEIGASVSFYFDVEGLREFHHAVVEKTGNVSEIKTTWYGMDEFYMRDCNGYVLGFAESAQK